MDKLPDEIIKKIISYFYNCENLRFPLKPQFDIQTLGRLMSINRYWYEKIKQRYIWENYYRSLFKYWKIGKCSIHQGDQTYSRCQIGAYPGWANVHDAIDPKVGKCSYTCHYTKLVPVNKKVRWKKLFHKCAQRKYTLLKKKYRWSKIKRRKLECLYRKKKLIDRQVRELELYREKVRRIEIKFLPYMTTSQKCDLDVLTNDMLKLRILK